jgi:hypothetical protein
LFLPLLKLLADKAYSADRLNDFLCCHFRLLKDNLNTADYGHSADNVADRVHTAAEKEFVYKMDEALMSLGLFRKLYGGFECHGLAYYHSEKTMNAKGPYTYRLVSRTPDIENNPYETEKLRLMLRIRSVSSCLEYLKGCPDSVNRIFTDWNDAGCGKRISDDCKHGISYEISGTLYWRCGCCHSPFSFKPQIESIPHYLKLVELGEKK